MILLNGVGVSTLFVEGERTEVEGCGVARLRLRHLNGRIRGQRVVPSLVIRRHREREGLAISPVAAIQHLGQLRSG